MRPKARPATLLYLFCQPVRQRVVGKWVAVLHGCAVGGMGVPVVDMQEPVIPLGVLFDPVQRQRGHVIRQFHPALAWIVGFTPAGVPPPRGVALAKRADGHRIQTSLAQLGNPTGGLHPVAELAPRTLVEWVGCHPAVVDRPVMKTGPPAPQRRPRGQAGRIGDIAVVKAPPLAGNPIQVGAGVAVVAVAAQVVWAQGVDVDE